LFALAPAPRKPFDKESFGPIINTNTVLIIQVDRDIFATGCS
jgi:hypothetical protein